MAEPHSQWERNLLFGVLALHLELITAEQFAEVCTESTSKKGTPLDELLIQRGWLTDADWDQVNQLLQRKLMPYEGSSAPPELMLTTSRRPLRPSSRRRHRVADTRRATAASQTGV